MKKFTLALALFCACWALAYAGPEPLPAKEIAPAPPPPTSCFEGWYFGIHGGAILSNFDNSTDAFEETFAPRGGSESAFDSSGKHDETSGEGGLHAGYNWQRGHWVFGLEVDIQGSDLSSTSEATAIIELPPGAPFFFTTDVTAKTQVDWYATGRLRVGYALADRFMIFGTGGGAGGLTEFNVFSDLEADTPVGLHDSDFALHRDREIRGGWTAGGGIDFCLSQHWMLNFTYLYVDLGDRSRDDSLFAISTQGRTFFGDTHASTDFKFHVFQGGLSFHF
jgi:outer membrane immunogenic protein